MPLEGSNRELVELIEKDAGESARTAVASGSRSEWAMLAVGIASVLAALLACAGIGAGIARRLRGMVRALDDCDASQVPEAGGDDTGVLAAGRTVPRSILT